MEVELKDATGRVVALARETRRFAGHLKTVWGAEFSPDGSRWASASEDETVRVWDSRSGETLLVLRGHEHHVRSVSHSPDGTCLASASYDNTVRVWDSRSGEALLVLRGHERAVESVKYSPDGARLASASWDDTVRVWDSRTGESLLVLRGHEGHLTSVSYSPDGVHLASASKDGTVQLWDSRSGEALLVLRGHESGIWDVSYSPDGTRLMTASTDDMVRVWDSRSGEVLHVLRGHKHIVNCVSPSPDGTRFASASNYGVRIWDAATGHCLAELLGLYCVAWSPDGTSLVTGADGWGVLVQWTVTEVAATRPSPLQQLAARQARTVGLAPPTLVMPAPWVPQIAGASGDCLGVLRHHEPDEESVDTYYGWTVYMGGIQFAADGRTLFTSDEEGQVHAWDLTTGHRADRMRHHEEVRSLSLSPDGARIATASWDKAVRVWDSRTGAPIHVLDHEAAVHSVDHSPDGTRLASASRDKLVRVWDSRTGAPILALHGHEADVMSVCHAPDGTRLASSSMDGTVRLWDSRTGAEVLVFRGHQGLVWCASYSPDGARIASASSDQTVRVWDSRTGAQLLVLQGHTSVVTSVSHSHDGTRLASSSSDGTVRIWDAATGICLQCWNVPEGSDFRVVWAPGGTFLASTRYGGSVRVWDVRNLLPATSSAPAPLAAPPLPVPREFVRLPALAAALLRHRGHTLALATLRDVLRLLRSGTPDGVAATLMTHRHLWPLQSLHWPPDALAALVLLLCADAHDASFAPPNGTTPIALQSALSSALAAGTSVPEEIFTTAAWTAIRTALDDLDPARLLTLLHALGPDTCAASPHILLTLANRLKTLVPLSSPIRELLSTTARLDRRDGHAHSPLGLLPAGTRATGPPWTLRPWQWALPLDAFDYRLVRRLLLHTDRRGAEPPRLRPTVLILDDSVESLPVEPILRAAALLVATALLHRRIPAYLLTTASRRATPLASAAHLADLLTPVHPSAVDTSTILARADHLARALTRTADDPPVILLLTHVYFTADAEHVYPSPTLRAMFVRYPRFEFTPAHLHRYLRHAILGANDLAHLPNTLADLLR